MDNVAFKRAKVCPAVRDSLHPDFIVEYANTSLFQDGFHKPEDGYEILPEDQFVEEFAKNEQLMQEYQKTKELDVAQRARTKALEDQRLAREESLAQKEFQEFLDWKRAKEAQKG